MAKMGSANSSQMKKFQKDLNKLQGAQKEEFFRQCAKELAARLLAKAIKRTPVGQYPQGSGKVGGTLRRGWTSKTHGEAEKGSGKGASAKSYADSLQVKHIGNIYEVEIINPVEYASYVEHGHRTRDHKGWVPGQFMLTISEEEIRKSSPKILEAKLNKFLGEVFK